jgi:hypothetical protein
MSVNTDQAIFDAIVAAIHLSEKRSVTISVQKFIETFNSHRDRKLCTSLNMVERDELPRLKPPPGELTVECPKCHWQVSETCCAYQDFDYYKDCYCYITRRDRKEPVEERNRIAQSAPETHGPLPSGEVDLTVMSDCSGAGAAQTPDSAYGVAAYERGFRDGVFVGREMPGLRAGDQTRAGEP